MNRRHLFISLAIVAGVLLGAELAAHVALPSIPGSIEVERNPFRFRGWPEYVRAPDTGPREATLILLTNSQGYAGELPPRKIYAERLERLLNERGAGPFERWHVLNWSTDGMTSIELVILAGVLQDLSPTVVMAVTGYADYAAEHADQGFLYCRSDIPRLAARPDIAFRLPKSYWKRHGKLEDTVTFLMRDRLALLRFRGYAWSWLEARFPGVHEILFAPGVNFLPWEMRARAITAPVRQPGGRAADPKVTYGPASSRMLAEYVDMLASLKSKVIVVSEPVRIDPHDKRTVWNEAYLSDIARETARRTMLFWDLHDALPLDAFITSSHLHPRNHIRLAELLYERLHEEFSESS